MGKNQHVVLKDGKWTVKEARAKKATWTGNTRGEAINVARAIAMNQSSQMVIHEKDGTIDTAGYGISPRLPKGKKR